MKKQIIFLFIFTIVLPVFISPVYGWGRASGLGGMNPALMGSEGIVNNPAAGGLAEESFSITLSGIAGFYNNLYYKDYSDDNFLSGIEDNGLIFNTAGTAGLFLRYGGISGFIRPVGKGLISVSEDMAELLLKGTEIDREYILENTEGRGALYVDTGISISYHIPQDQHNFEELYVGVSYRQLQGVIFDLEASGSLTVVREENEPELSGDGKIRLSYNDLDSEGPAVGSAVDIGLYARLKDYSLGISMVNLGNLSISEAQKDTYHFSSENDNNENDNNIEAGEPETETLDEGLSWNLPAVYRVGGAVDFNEEVDIFAVIEHVSYDNGVNDNLIGVGTEMSYHTGIPVRLGANYSTLRSSLDINAGIGLELGIFKMNIGAGGLTGLFNRAKDISIAVSTSLSF